MVHFMTCPPNEALCRVVTAGPLLAMIILAMISMHRPPAKPDSAVIVVQCCPYWESIVSI